MLGIMHQSWAASPVVHGCFLLARLGRLPASGERSLGPGQGAGRWVERLYARASLLLRSPSLPPCPATTHPPTHPPPALQGAGSCARAGRPGARLPGVPARHPRQAQPGDDGGPGAGAAVLSGGTERDEPRQLASRPSQPWSATPDTASHSPRPGPRMNVHPGAAMHAQAPRAACLPGGGLSSNRHNPPSSHLPFCCRSCDAWRSAWAVPVLHRGQWAGGSGPPGPPSPQPSPPPTSFARLRLLCTGQAGGASQHAHHGGRRRCCRTVPLDPSPPPLAMLLSLV